VRGKYKAAFVLPENTETVLGECGWEFESEDYICVDVEFFLIDILKLRFSNCSHGIKYFVGENIEASIEFEDDSKNIKYIYFQIYHDQVAVLSEAFENAACMKGLQLFIPSER